MKKLLATILALVMALSLCITVWADLPVAGEGGIVTVDKDVTLSANYEVMANRPSVIVTVAAAGR